jgi:hypothetical protein
MGSSDEKNERVRLRSFIWGAALTAPHKKISSNEAPQTKIFSVRVRFLVNPFAREGGKNAKEPKSPKTHKNAKR